MSDLKEKIKAAQIDLIKELGIDKLDQEQKEKLIMDIGQILQERIALRVTEELPEEKIEEFKAILDKAEADPAQLDQFLKENIPGIEDLILEEIGEYKKSALDFVNQALSKDIPLEEGKIEKQDEGIKSDEEQQGTEEQPTVEQAIEEVKEPEEVAPVPVEQLEKQGFQEVIETEKLPEQVEVAEESQKEIEAPLPVEKLEEPLEIIEKAEDFKEEKAEPEMNIEPSGIEQERIDQEAQIIEENKIENNQIASEELDLSNELEKMEDQDVSGKEQE